MASPSIAIVGAGPAGLTLARLLANANIELNVTIFEHSASAKARHQQGGTLDLHPDSGLRALKSMGLLEEARSSLRYEGEELVIADLNGCQLVHMKDNPPPKEASEAADPGLYTRPEIDREKLVDLLLKSVGEDKVHWGKHLKRVNPESNQLEFEDGTTAGPFDLIIGADGAWSKVRKVLSDDFPHYSGICGIEGHIYKPSDHPRINRLIGRGSYFSFSGGQACMAQRMSDNSIKSAFYFKRPETFIDDLVGGDKIDEEPLRAKILDEYVEWCPEIREIVEVATLSEKWKLYELPVGTTWTHKPGYTLLGDAAHLCTPFAGLGVNAAMLDALELSDCLIAAVKDGSTSLDAAIKKYEEEMFPRAKKVQEQTMRNKTNGFREDAPICFITGMLAPVAEETGWPIDKGLLYFVPITKLAYTFFWVKTSIVSVRRTFGRLIWGEKSLRA